MSERHDIKFDLGSFFSFFIRDTNKSLFFCCCSSKEKKKKKIESRIVWRAHLSEVDLEGAAAAVDIRPGERVLGALR